MLLTAAGALDVGPVHVVVAGSGPQAEPLRDLAGRIGVPVHFVGHQCDVAPWLAMADVIAIPSRSEAFGRTTIEAGESAFVTLSWGQSSVPASRRWQKLAQKKRIELNEQMARVRAMSKVVDHVLQCQCADLSDCGRVALAVAAR